MKKIVLLFLFSFFVSCQFLEKFKKSSEETDTKKALASVFDSKLYLSDVKNLVPKDLNPKDSVIFVKGIINSWAKQQILFKKAEENISETEDIEINNLVKKYKEDLYINKYKEELIKKQLDTVINQEQIDSFYEKNKDNFKLANDILKVKYIIIDKNDSDKNKIIKLFKSDKEEDIDKLESYSINFTDYSINDQNWISYEKILTKIPVFRNEKRNNVLKLSKFMQKKDSLKLYLVAINEVRKKNETAPLEYVIPKIKELIIHKRKFELIREIEKTLLNDAIKNNTFKEYN